MRTVSKDYFKGYIFEYTKECFNGGSLNTEPASANDRAMPSGRDYSWKEQQTFTL